ncbi:unnamed protein product [Ceratitis capitata]|uniref:(Mediterranean fruit fly) hypothetical protein n=1 Tax=Ceratitis capitata TaxID=7213 RepID=A0A811U9J0_CERCA|nr:unnamed protein product [Ceratitis capitata]
MKKNPPIVVVVFIVSIAVAAAAAGRLIDDVRMRNSVSHIYSLFYVLLCSYAVAHLLGYLNHSNRSFCIYVLFNGELITLNNTKSNSYIFIVFKYNSAGYRVQGNLFTKIKKCIFSILVYSLCV